MDAIGSSFPERLPLIDQGRFVIGYHHQKAAGMAAAMAAKQQKIDAQLKENSGE
jgi:hypothetical protein